MATPEASQPLAENLTTQYGSAACDAKGGDAPDETASPEGKGKVFPLRPFKCFPALEQHLPGNVMEIQNCIHLLLFLSSFATLFLSVDYVRFITSRCEGDYCHVRYVALVYLLFCTLEFVLLMQQYDGRVVMKQKQVKKEQKAVHQAYEDSIKEMEGHLKTAMSTNISLAEQNFNGYRRDLLKFMQRYPRRLRGNTPDGLLDEFRKFVIHWLDVFAECSADPLHKPRSLVNKDELIAQETVADACGLMVEPLQALEVKFLEEAKEKDTAQMKTLQFKLGRTSEMQAIAQTQWAKLCGVKEDVNPESQDPAINLEAGKANEPMHKKIKYRWVQWGSRDQFLAFEEPEVRHQFPREFNAGFVRVILLSVEHVRILLMFMLGFLALYVEDGCQFFNWLGMHSGFVALREAVEEIPNPPNGGRGYTRMYFWDILACQVAMAFILWDYLNIDVCLKLDKEIAQLQRQQEDIKAKRVAMKEFYDNLSELADFWLHHSLTRLELLKYFFEELGTLTENPGEGRDMLLKVNPCIAALEDSLPSLEMWLSKDATKQFTPEEKTPFIEGLAELPNICNKQGVDQGLEAIRKTSSDLGLKTQRLSALSEGL